MCLVLQMLIWAEDTGPGLPAAWESMKEEIQAKPRKPCAATGTKKEPPFPGIHTRALVSQGKVQLQGLWAHRTLGKEAPPGAGSPSPQLPASPRGTRTELVTFHPQHVTFMKHSRIQGKEGKSQVGTLSRLSRKPAHPPVSTHHPDSTAFKAAWVSNFSHRSDATSCSVIMPGFQLSPQLFDPQEFSPWFLFFFSLRDF